MADLIGACRARDVDAARRALSADPSLSGELDEVLRDPALQAVESGETAAIAVMLDLGFAIEQRVGSDGATLLHAAAYSGDACTVGLLLDRGASVAARDRRWGSMPLEWACIGSGEAPTDVPAPDWVTVVQMLIDAGASTAEVTVSADQPKPPSRDVAALLRAQGVL